MSEPGSLEKTINLGTEFPEISIRALAEIILGVVDRSLDIRAMPSTEGSPSRRLPSMKLFENIMKFQPKVSLEDGIKRTYDWYRPKMN